MVKVRVKARSVFGASLLDGEGRLLRELVESKTVDPGIYVLEWDGTLIPGVPVKYDFPYLIRVTANEETQFAKAMPRAVR